MNYRNGVMTTLIVATLELTKPVREPDLPIIGITCLLIYKGGFVHVFHTHKRNKIIIIIIHHHHHHHHHHKAPFLPIPISGPCETVTADLWDNYVLLHLTTDVS